MGLLFEFGFRPDADAASIYDAAAEVREMPEDEFEKGLFLGTVENLDAIDAAIAANAHGWKMGVARAVLRLGTYEILFTDVPDSVAVNEAIEIIKKYDDAKVRSFVNGILNAVMKSKADASSDNDAEGEK